MENSTRSLGSLYVLTLLLNLIPVTVSLGQTPIELGKPRIYTTQPIPQIPQVDLNNYKKQSGNKGSETLPLPTPLKPGDSSLPWKKKKETQPFSLDVPTGKRLFQRTSETQLRRKLQEEASSRGQQIEFPRVLPKPVVQGISPRIDRSVPVIVEPYYLCYGRLWFEQRGAERYGKRCRFVQPTFCAARFLFDLGTWPLRGIGILYRCQDCNVGLPLPGDPVPMRWNMFWEK